MKLILLLSLFMSFSIFSQNHTALLENKIPLQTIHNILFNLYFPDTNYLSDQQKTARLNWRSQLWDIVQSDLRILSLLDLLQPDSTFLPADVKEAFADILFNGVEKTDKKRIEDLGIALRRHPNNDVRKFASTLRRIYSYLNYMGPLTEQLSGVPLAKRTDEAQRIILPESQLILEGNEIKHRRGQIDYLIIGSGPAGSLIAHELCRSKNRVVLLEAGSFIQPQTTITESAAELMEYQNQRTTATGGILLRNGCVVGGATTVNLDLAFSPLLPEIKKKLQLWLDSGWLNKAFIHKGSSDWALLDHAYDWVCRKLKTRAVNELEINLNNKILLDSCANARTYWLNQKYQNASDVVKISAVDAFIMPALMKKNKNKRLNLISDVKINRVIFENDQFQKANGVEITFQNPINKKYVIKDVNNFKAIPGQKAIIQAKNIILCAGTLGSAEILMRSQVPNPNIGKGIILHPSMAIFGRFSREINATDGLSASVYAPSINPADEYFFESMAADPAFAAIVHQGSGEQITEMMRNFKYFGGFGIMLIDSVSRNNRILINPKTNEIEIDYRLTDSDKNRMRLGIASAIEKLLDQGAVEVYLPTSEPILSYFKYLPITAKEQIPQVIENLHFIENQTILSSAHMQSSNKMGNNPENSVVSLNFKVWNASTKREISNLYVCDSSIFPTSVGANPMQSIYTFAKLFVDNVLTPKSFIEILAAELYRFMAF